MIFKSILNLVIFIVFLSPAFISSQSISACQENDYLALRALYLNTDGDNWINSNNWPNEAFFLANPTMPPSTDISTWQGLTVDADGILTRIFKRTSNIAGPLPPEIGLLCRIEEINLRNNQLDGTIPIEFWDLTTLKIIEFGGNNGFNELTGTLPADIAQLTALTHLDLANNEFFGALPPEIGQLTNLTDLLLGGNSGFNEFSGMLPSSFCNLVNLEFLNLANNLFVGPFPTCIGNFTSLTSLNMGGNPNTNDFTGPFPDLSNLTNLSSLYLSGNSLTGSLPAYLASLPNLSIISIQNNQLSGCYDNTLTTLCTQLNPGFNKNVFISVGNSFDANWEDFCNTMAGACCASPDTENPVVSCTGDPIFEFVNTGNCDAAVIDFQAHVEASMMATDNCGVDMVICSPASGSTFLLGQDVVTCIAVDLAGNMSQTCTFQVEVVPSVLFANVTMVNDESCPGQGDGAIDVTTSDGLAPYSYAWSNGATTEDITGLDPGMYGLTVTDNIGCQYSTTVTVSTVPDTEDPFVSCTGPVFIADADPSNCSDAIVNFQADVESSMMPTDNCRVAMIICSPASGSVFPLGQSVVVCQAYDTSLNSSLQCTFTLEVQPCPCPSTLQLSGNINNSINQANVSITSNGLVSTNQNVTFRAGQEIELTAGFNVESPSMFHAYIETCN